jgi:Tfp pilus assembly protein PilE
MKSECSITRIALKHSRWVWHQRQEAGKALLCERVAATERFFADSDQMAMI